MYSRKKTDGVLQNFKLAIVITIILIIAGAIWGGISHLIEESNNKRRDDQLDEVLDVCTGKEDSNTCKKLQKDYNITFKYCKSIADPIDKQYKFITLPNGETTMISNPIWHAVAWEGKSDTPPNNSNLKIYYDCSNHIE